MPVALTHRFTVTDYYRMAETGILKPNARVELVEGEIVDMSPIGPFHSGSVYRLTRLFNGLSQGRWLVASQGPLQIDEHNHPEPDLMLLRPADDDFTTSHPTPADVFLLIEVSDSSLSFDQSIKLPVYARAGIKEVWILNAPLKQLEIYREPTFLGYGSKSVLRTGAVAPKWFPDAEVVVEELVN